jgi:hypothetical protein
MKTTALLNAAVLVATSGLCASYAEQRDAHHGTCAIALATNTDIAVIVDSKLTPMAEPDKGCTVAGKQDCKVFLVKKDVLLVITGLFDDNGWKVSDVTRPLLERLPEKVSEESLDYFGRWWAQALVAHLTKSHLQLPPGRLISSLLICTRIDGAPYATRMDVNSNRDGTYEYGMMYLHMSGSPSLLYAGSCGDYVGSNPSGIYHLPQSPPDPNFRFELKELGDEKRGLRTVEQFASLLRRYENLFESIGDSKGQCWIGPPYNVATWSQGTDGWKADFQSICRLNQHAQSGRSSH